MQLDSRLLFGAVLFWFLLDFFVTYFGFKYHKGMFFSVRIEVQNSVFWYISEMFGILDLLEIMNHLFIYYFLH